MSRKNRNQRKGISPSRMSPGMAFYDPLINPRQVATSRTQEIEWELRRHIMEISMQRFKWEGFPDTVNKRWLEQALMYNALAVFFRDDDYGGTYFATFASPAGNYNLVGDPTMFRAYGANNMKSWELDIDHCVPIWANWMRMPDIDTISIYSRRLSELDRTIEINAKNARQNKIIGVPENMRLTAENINSQIESGSQAIKVSDEIDVAGMIQVLDLGIHPDQVINLSILRARIWSQLMTRLGINNDASADKKERKVAAEVSGNDDMINVIREANLTARKEACEKINKMFDLNVSVDHVTDMNQTALKDTGSEGAKEVEE